MWMFQMTEENVRDMCNQLGMSNEDYIDECKKALTTNGGYKSFTYKLDGNIFQWKKISLEMKITFGSVQLNEVINS